MRNYNEADGHLVFVKDEFFELVNEPYLKINKGKGHSRSHYFAFKVRDNEDMYWVAPLSSKVKKFDKIVQNKKSKGRKTDIFFKTEVWHKDNYVLLGDMFPVHKRYIYDYCKMGQLVKINKKDRKNLSKIAYRTISKLNRGAVFSPTSPNVKRIKKIQIEHEKELKAEHENDVMENLQEFVDKYNIKMSNDKEQERKR